MAKQAADTTVLVQPNVRVLTDWKPASIRAAIAQADGGTQRTIADLTDCLLGDDRVNGAMSGRVRTLLGCPLSFEAGQKGDRTKELDEDWWDMAPEAELSLVYQYALVSGRGVARMQHSFDEEKKRWIPRIDPWHPQLVRYDTEVHKLFAKIGTDTEEEILPEDGKWWVVEPYGKVRPWALALCRGLSPWLLLKWFAIDDWGNHSDKAVAHVATSPVGVTRGQRQELAADIKSLARNGVLCLPPGFDLKLVESTADTRDIYNAQIEAANSAITIAIRGSNLGTETTGGSFAAAKSQGEQDDELKRFDGGVLSTQLKPLIRQWARLNFGDPLQAPWAKWEIEPQEDLAKKVETQTKAAASVKAWQDLGATVDVLASAKEVGVILVEGAPFVPGGEKPPEPIANVPSGGDSTSAAFNDRRLIASAGIKDKGLIDGQTYADCLTVTGRDRATAALSTDLDELLTLIEATEDGPDWGERLQAALVEQYGKMDQSKFAEVLEKALILGELAGKYAVLEDL